MQMTNVLHIKTRQALRKWLVENHDKEKQAWIPMLSKDPDALSYLAIVEESICFGWIDSTKKRGEGATFQRISPRRKSGNWTELNKERARRLIKTGQMMPQGMAILPDLDVENFTIQQEILDTLKADPATYENFLKLPPLYVRVRIDNIQSYPHSDETYLRRLEKFLANTKSNILYGDWNDNGRLEQSFTMAEQYFEYGEKELAHLRKKDKKLGAAIDRMGIIKRRVNPDLFSALVESVVGQQISNKAAATVCGRLDVLCGMNAGRLHALSLEEIQACGMSMRKAAYIKNIAEATVNKILDFDEFPQKSDAAIIASLTAIKGVGVWTAEMLLIFSLMRPNVVSYGDLAIRRGMMQLYGLKDLSKEQFAKYAKRYAPYGSVASLYLWEMSH